MPFSLELFEICNTAFFLKKHICRTQLKTYIAYRLLEGFAELVVYFHKEIGSRS